MPHTVITTPAGAEAFQQAMAAFDYPQALTIAQTWQSKEPNNPITALAVARASCALADMAPTEPESDVHVKRAQAVLKPLKGSNIQGTSPAILDAPAAAVWNFHYAESIALRARWKGAGALPLLGDIASHAEAAAKLSPGYDGAAPLRVLGMLLIKAPAWPTGPGDSERGAELLEQAVRLAPQRAEGHIHRADWLLDQSRVQEGEAALKRGRELAGKNPRAIKLANEVGQRLKANRGVKTY